MLKRLDGAQRPNVRFGSLADSLRSTIPGLVVKRSQAWHDLSLAARCALIELIDRYNGINNGMIGLGVRELAKALRCSQGTACNALRELDDLGLARSTTGGMWRGKRATEWRLTFHRCDKTGALPIKSWPRAE